MLDFLYASGGRGTTRRAGRIALSLLLNKERAKENQPKGLIPFGNPQCVFVGATLSLRATRRKSKLFQRLRLQVQKTCKHGSGTQDAIAKALASVQRGL
jgi:hypothetical protein